MESRTFHEDRVGDVLSIRELHISYKVVASTPPPMSSTVLNSSSISELPLPEFFGTSNKFTYVNLPVVCLALLRRPEWNFGFMLVTDFTEYFHNPYAVGRSPESLPESFSLGNIFALELSKVFAITVPRDKMDLYWRDLCLYSPRMRNYDPQDEKRCNFAQEGIIAMINMRVKLYSMMTEGWLTRIQICNRTEMKKSAFKAHLKKFHFGGFMTRFLKHVDKTLYDTILPSFPIDSYLKPEDIASNGAGGVKRPYDELITQAPKSRSISAAQITFKQQFTQRPAESPEEEEEELPSFGLDHANETQNTNHDNVSSQRPAVRNKWLNYSVSRVSFSTISSMSMHDTPEVTMFETTCVLANILPEIDLLFVRPYKRTMKIPPIKLTLTGSKNERIFAELHTESEINKFFGVQEVEEVIPNIERISNKLRQLTGLQIKIRLQKALLNLDFGYQKEYWACRTQLQDLGDVWNYSTQN